LGEKGIGGRASVAMGISPNVNSRRANARRAALD
jgi:hypothetical protein